jgi:tRNA 2-thiouridine synthesizing protein A
MSDINPPVKIAQKASTHSASADRRLDVRGEHCPTPALEARRHLDDMKVGEVLEVLSTDPLAEMDLQILCDRLGYELIETRAHRGEQSTLIRVTQSRQADAD